MTTLPLVSTGAGAPTLPDAASHTDTAPHADTLLARADADAHRGGGDALALFTASHDMHPLAQQQAYVKQGGAHGGSQVKAATHQPVPDAATRTYDVATTSKADIDALKNSPDKQQQRLGHTIENLQNSYRDLLDGKKVNITVTMNPANGKEPVATMTSAALDPKLPVRVHTHYHGDNATIGDPEGSKAGQNSRIRATLARDPQTVFVLPECQSKQTERDSKPDSPKHNLEYKAEWGNVKSQAETTDLALAAAGLSKAKIEKETVSVHSRGGNVIQAMMHNDDGSGRKLRADRLELHDSLYGSQDAVARWGKTTNGQQVEKVIYVHGNNGGIHGDGRDREIAKTFKGSYIRIDVGLLKPGHETTRDGQPAYNKDPHYQTTGRFLGIWPLPN